MAVSRLKSAQAIFLILLFGGTTTLGVRQLWLHWFLPQLTSHIAVGVVEGLERTYTGLP